MKFGNIFLLLESCFAQTEWSRALTRAHKWETTRQGGLRALTSASGLACWVAWHTVHKKLRQTYLIYICVCDYGEQLPITAGERFKKSSIIFASYSGGLGLGILDVADNDANKCTYFYYLTAENTSLSQQEIQMYNAFKIVHVHWAKWENHLVNGWRWLCIIEATSYRHVISAEMFSSELWESLSF